MQPFTVKSRPTTPKPNFAPPPANPPTSNKEKDSQVFVYIVRYGYYYEHDNILGVYSTRYRAKKAIETSEELDFYKSSNNAYINIEMYTIE